MKKLTEFNKADYQGFTLKQGFWYGKNLRGQAIASSGWVNNEYVYVYTRTEDGWLGDWVECDNFILLGQEFSDYCKKVMEEERYWIEG